MRDSLKDSFDYMPVFIFIYNKIALSHSPELIYVDDFLTVTDSRGLIFRHELANLSIL